MLNTEEREQKTSTSVCDIIILDKYFKSFLHMGCQMVCALWFFGRTIQYFFPQRIFFLKCIVSLRFFVFCKLALKSRVISVKKITASDVKKDYVHIYTLTQQSTSHVTCHDIV